MMIQDVTFVGSKASMISRATFTNEPVHFPVLIEMTPGDPYEELDWVWVDTYVVDAIELSRLSEDFAVKIGGGIGID